MEINANPALVTGGGSGLGEATARRLAQCGAQVAVLDIDTEGAQRVAADIGGIALRCDVTSEADAASAIEMAKSVYGPARILVNCAGVVAAARVLGRAGPMPLAEFHKTITVNLVGSFNMLRLAAHEMQTLDPLDSGERGVAISTASIAAYEGQIGQAAYAASKGGIVAMTLPIAREMARVGIRVLAIAPGLFDTPLLQGLPGDVSQVLSETTPFPNRLGQPDEFAQLAQSMIENPYLNGEVIRLDGALRMAPE